MTRVRGVYVKAAEDEDDRAAGALVEKDGCRAGGGESDSVCACVGGGKSGSVRQRGGSGERRGLCLKSY